MATEIEDSIHNIMNRSYDPSVSGLKSSIQAASSDYYPGYGDYSQGGGRIYTDPGGNIITRGGVLTDAGGFRANFTGSTVSASLGICTFEQGSDVVTGTGFASNNLVHSFDYVKLGSDTDASWAQVFYVGDDNTLHLVEPYTGTGGTGEGIFTILKPTIGTGGAIAVANGALTITSGTTSSAVTRASRQGDAPPMIFNARVTMSQRIANQDAYVGSVDLVNATPRYFARFKFTGTVNTSVITETGWAAEGAPTANETETTTVTLPGALTTALANDYRIEIESDRVTFFVNNAVVSVHTRVTMHPYLLMGNYASIENGTSPASTTTLTVDYCTLQNIESFKTMPLSISDTKWRYASLTTSGLVKTGAGTLGTISIMQTDGTAVTAGQLTITDNTATGGTIIWKGQVTASMGAIPLNVDFVKGCYVTYTTLAAVTTNLSYR